MLVTINRERFDTLDPDELGWACIGPILLQVRGKNSDIKSQVYAKLTPGQQALFMFRVLHDHARNSAAEYYCWISYLLEDVPTWSEIKHGLLYIGEEALLHHLEETERYLVERSRQNGAPFSHAALRDIEDDTELRTFISFRYEQFLDLVPHAHVRMCSYVRTHTDEFVLFE
ncbi:hypothetical protein LQV63_15975 [Paenibacillus profundus]|uniref:Uncharacterized protein n=1 Tax=Paenibacillus profundus TaxID=1173085 RepID=A0ABS8YFN4_9BACL|nr:MULTISPECIES: hypothetical protein [Paenibacillus]MCE5170803.1 hypothetical protein [Paenibacillus profundus]MCM3342470.1 hypothetical protein [Paenibacillus sp. MER TA 81-3]